MLTFILHIFIGATLAGILIVVALVAGHGSGWVLAGAVAAGMVLGLPLARIIAKAMGDR